ncbi:MAG: hypothetical protein AB8B67_05100 [Rickettsiaceae bacterium]
MLKSIKKQLDVGLVALAAIFALVYLIMFNFVVLYKEFDSYQSNAQALIITGKNIALLYSILFVIFFGITIHNALFVSISLSLFITGAIASYFTLYLDIIPNENSMREIFGSSRNSIYQAIKPQLVVWVAFSIGIALYTIKYFGFSNSRLFINKIIASACLLWTISSIIDPYNHVIVKYFPMQYLHSAYQALFFK